MFETVDITARAVVGLAHRVAVLDASVFCAAPTPLVCLNA
jgi:hypothetical protein